MATRKAPPKKTEPKEGEVKPVDPNKKFSMEVNGKIMGSITQLVQIGFKTVDAPNTADMKAFSDSMSEILNAIHNAKEV